MRRLALLLGLLVGFDASATEKGGMSGGIVPSLEDLTRVTAADPRYKEAAESKPLFFRVPDPGAREVQFRVTVGDRLYLDETVALPQPVTAKGSPAVEFLARDPQRLERLYALAANKVLPVKVSVAVDGKDVQAFSFDEFVQYNKSLKFSGLRPVAGESKLTLRGADPPSRPAPDRIAAAPQPDGPCEDQCWWDYQYCLEGCQGGCPYPPCPLPLTSPRLPFPGDCSYCDEQYNNCVNSCPPPCTPGQVLGQTTYSETQLVAIYGYYWECLNNWWDQNPYWGEWFQWTEWVYKTTTYRRTEYCQAPPTVEVIGVSYGSYFCQYPLYISCSYPWGTAWQRCF